MQGTLEWGEEGSEVSRGVQSVRLPPGVALMYAHVVVLFCNIKASPVTAFEFPL